MLCILLYIGPPVINFISNSKITFEGRKVNLMCKATNDVDAINQLSIDWYSPDGIRVQSEDKHILVNSTTDPVTGQMQSVLLFDPVDRTNSGEYTCHAFNDIDCYTNDTTNLITECELLKTQYHNCVLSIYIILQFYQVVLSLHHHPTKSVLVMLCSSYVQQMDYLLLQSSGTSITEL